MEKCIQFDSRPVVLYDVEKRQVIGVFGSPTLAGRYLFPESFSKYRVHNAISRKHKITNSFLKTKVAARYADEEKQRLLGDSLFVIMNGYPEPAKGKMNGFISTRIQMAEDHRKERQVVGKNKK